MVQWRKRMRIVRPLDYKDEEGDTVWNHGVDGGRDLNQIDDTFKAAGVNPIAY